MTTVLLALALLASAPASAASGGSIGITILSPGSIGGNPLPIAATVTSTFQLSRVYATIAAQDYDLVFGPSPSCSACWSATVPLNLAHGTYTITITAVDVFGNTGSASRVFTLNLRPVLTFTEPLDNAVARPGLRISASCSDDTANCQLRAVASNSQTSVIVASSTDAPIQTVVSLAAFETQLFGSQVTLTMTATDADGQTTSVARTIYVDSSTHYRARASVDGLILAFDETRLLVARQVPGSFKMLLQDRATGQETVLLVQTTADLTYGFLTPLGAIFVWRATSGSLAAHVFEWRDGTLVDRGPIPNSQTLRAAGLFAIWSTGISPTPLMYEDIATGVVTTIAPEAINTKNGVAASGEVDYAAQVSAPYAFGYVYRIFRYQGGSITPLPHGGDPATFDLSPRTDGTSVLYLRTVPNSQTTLPQVVAVVGGVERILGDVNSTDPDTTYQAAGGWIAYRIRGTGGVNQIWVGPASGPASQVSFFGQSSTLAALDGSGAGRVAFVNLGRTYLASSTLAAVDIGTSAGTTTFQQGICYRIIGNTLFEASPDSVAEPPVIAIVSPTSAPTFATGAATLAMSGTASDDSLVVQVTWANDRGGSGTASGTTNWSIPSVPLQPGLNVITVTASDGVLTTSATLRVSVPVPPAIAITFPTSASTYATNAATVSVAGTAADDVAVTQVTWANSLGGSGTASGTTTWSIASVPLQLGVNVITVTASDGSLTSSATLTITRSPLPTMTLDKTSLVFGAVTTGAAFTSQTSAQSVFLSQRGTGSVTWTAASDRPWLVVSPASGSGPATLTISTRFAAGLTSAQAGTVTLTFTGADNAPGPVAVALNTFSSDLASAPVGSFDTPIDGVTGVTGSLAVTGWALDDMEVTRVSLCREALIVELAPLDARCNGPSRIYLGDASLVEGARPDVQALYLNTPRNSRAGWGYLLLTYFLPSLGNGTFKLYAIASDVDGHSTTLGSKTITCANSTATAPFGAIDTPAQGATVSGNVTNFGWVLSPAPAHASPFTGGIVRVVIDGAIMTQVPGGWTSRSDLTALFPVAQFPGVANALGAEIFDSTTLTNGVHTIAWLASDNQGPREVSGIGSRYFTVSNGSGLTVDPESFRLKAEATGVHEENSWLPPSGGSLVGRRGFDLAAPYRTYKPDGDGRITIQAEELDRIELQLGVGASGYMRVAGQQESLPIGSQIDPVTGTFTWHPGVGFVGAYDLVLGGRNVRIVLNPKGSGRLGPQTIIDVPLPPEGGSHEISEIDPVASAFRRKDPILVVGWAADLDSAIDTGVDTVHVWAYPTRGGDPIFVGAADYGGARPDVAAIYGERFLKSGYCLTVRGLAPGTYDLAVFAYSTVRGGFVPAKTVRVTVR